MTDGNSFINKIWYQNLVEKQLELLEIDANNSKRIRCKCKKCGHEAWYDNKHDLVKVNIPCEMCRLLSTLDKTPKGDYVPIRCIPFTNEFGQVTAKVVCSCKRCGYKVATTYEYYMQKKDQILCSKCNTRKENQKIVPKKAAAARKVIEADKTRKIGENPDFTSMYNDKRGFNHKVWINNSTVGKTSHNLKALGVVSSEDLKDSKLKSSIRVFCICESCHRSADYDKSNFDSGKVSCQFCNTADARKFNDKLDSDTERFKGRVYNGLEIKKIYRDSEDKFKCKIKCCTCKEETEQDLYLVTERLVTCSNCMDIMKAGKNSKNAKVSIKCSKCDEIVDLTYRDMYSKDIKTCPYCDNKIEIVHERGLRDSDIQYRNTLKPYLSKGYGLKNVDLMKQLAIFGEAFRNRDGEMRYNCLCLSHNKELILTKEEIEAYEDAHKYCIGDKAKFMSMFKHVNVETTADKKRAEKEIVEETLRK